MTRTILGVDPGRQGAFALLDADDLRVASFDMPDTIAGVHALVLGLPKITICALEKPFYPQMIGVTNAAKIGEGYGVLKSALAWRDIPVREIRPAEWKKSLNLTSRKGDSRDRAGMFFPADADQFARVKDDGRAEAALLAWYARKWVK